MHVLTYDFKYPFASKVVNLKAAYLSFCRENRISHRWLDGKDETDSFFQTDRTYDVLKVTIGFTDYYMASLFLLT